MVIYRLVQAQPMAQGPPLRGGGMWMDPEASLPMGQADYFFAVAMVMEKTGSGKRVQRSAVEEGTVSLRGISKAVKDQISSQMLVFAPVAGKTCQDAERV